MELELLKKIPMSGKFKEVHFSAGSFCTWVKFTDDNFEEWIGIFGDGESSAVSDATLFHDKQYAFIIANGQGYVINTIHKTLIYKTKDDDLHYVIAVPDRDMVVVACYTDIYIYTLEGLEWSSPRIALDGVKFIKADHDKVYGYQWQIEGWYEFEFDINTRTITSQIFVTEKWEQIADL